MNKNELKLKYDDIAKCRHKGVEKRTCPICGEMCCLEKNCYVWYHDLLAGSSCLRKRMNKIDWFYHCLKNGHKSSGYECTHVVSERHMRDFNILKEFVKENE